MKKLALVLFVLLAVQSWGVYGAWQARKITQTCKAEVGPLCFLWEANTLGKLVGDTKSKELEETVEKARKAWEKSVVEKTIKDKQGKVDVDGTMRDLQKGLEEGFVKAKNAVEGTLQDVGLNK